MTGVLGALILVASLIYLLRFAITGRHPLGVME